MLRTSGTKPSESQRSIPHATSKHVHSAAISTEAAPAPNNPPPSQAALDAVSASQTRSISL